MRGFIFPQLLLLEPWQYCILNLRSHYYSCQLCSGAFSIFLWMAYLLTAVSCGLTLRSCVSFVSDPSCSQCSWWNSCWPCHKLCWWCEKGKYNIVKVHNFYQIMEANSKDMAWSFLNYELLRQLFISTKFSRCVQGFVIVSALLVTALLQFMFEGKPPSVYCLVALPLVMSSISIYQKYPYRVNKKES